MQIKLSLLVTDQSYASSIFGMIDALECANSAAQDLGVDFSFHITIVSQNGRSVSTVCGHKISVDSSIADINIPDVVIAMPSLEPKITDKQLTKFFSKLKCSIHWLQQLSIKGVTLGSSCTGAFLLAEAGLLEGKHATTHWRAADVFRQRYPEVLLQAQDLLTDDGNVVCGGAATSHVNLSLHLIRRFGGDAIANHCAHTLVIDPGRNLQSPFILTDYSDVLDDDLVGRVQSYIASNYSKPISVQSLSEAFNVGERTLMRRFKASAVLPVGLYIQSYRIDKAREMLATTGHPLKSIVFDVGFEDFSSFARLFKKKTGLTMQAYREQFRPAIN